MPNELYCTDLYFNWNAPLYAVDAEPQLTLEEREKRWKERRWLNEPDVVADDWLFAPLPSGNFDEF